MTLPKKRRENNVSFLGKFYGNQIPEFVDLSESHSERYDLQKYIFPFTGSKNDLIMIYGTSFSDPKPVWWEKQFNDFYENVICHHWDKNSKPGYGFKIVFRRACISGVMHSFGFEPKSPKEHAQEKREEKKRIELKEKQNLLAAKRRKEEEKKQAERQAKLTSLFKEVKKDAFSSNCFHHVGIWDIEGFERFIVECRTDGRVKDKQTLVEDLQCAIEKEYLAQFTE